LARPPPPYLHATQDYDVAKSPGDWDALKGCCDEARTLGITDSDCSNPLPARPAAPAPVPPATPGPTTPLTDFCVTSDYDFSQQEDRNLWTLCCEDAKKEGQVDPDCSKKLWR
jgi:hypothetical protein